MRIYFYHTDKSKRFFVTSLYSILGVDSGEKRLHYKNLNYEHTFPIVIDKKTQTIFTLKLILKKYLII